jgi:hypothetical protein
MKKMYLQAVMLTLACVLAGASNADAGPDAQGWNGRGWYITGAAPPALVPVAAPNYILLEGPHALPAECLEIYDRFYSPIGICRFLNVKPATLPRDASRADSGSKSIP